MTDLIIKAALDAGVAICKVYEQPFEVEYKDDASPLTQADLAAHRVIVDALSATPYPVLSEEGADVAYEERRSWGPYWLVDPLDGTKEFVKRTGQFTVNIARIENGQPTLGVVYAPIMDTLYVGVLDPDAGNAAWKTEGCKGIDLGQIKEQAVALTRSDTATLGDRALRVAASGSHGNAETTRFINDLEAVYGSVDLQSGGSSLKLCMVADGTVDIYPRIAPTMEWDTAAAHAVVRAAGGEVVQYHSELSAGQYIRYKEEGVGEDSMLHPLQYNKEDLLNPSFVVL